MENKEKLGRVLCPTVHEVNEMAQAVLVASSKVIPCRKLRRLSIAELNSEVKKAFHLR